MGLEKVYSCQSFEIVVHVKISIFWAQSFWDINSDGDAFKFDIFLSEIQFFEKMKCKLFSGECYLLIFYTAINYVSLECNTSCSILFAKYECDVDVSSCNGHFMPIKK